MSRNILLDISTRLLGAPQTPDWPLPHSVDHALRRGSMLRMTSRGEVAPRHNWIAAERRKGYAPLDGAERRRPLEMIPLSAVSSSSVAGRTNTLRQERIEVRRSSPEFQMDHGQKPLHCWEKVKLFPVLCRHLPRFICDVLLGGAVALYYFNVHRPKKHPAGTLTPWLDTMYSVCL